MPIGLVGKVAGGTVYVGSGPGNSTASIQDAIDNHANFGDTVFVYAGTYNENVVVNKIINLTGEDRDTTILDGGGGEVVTITANWVNITGFSIVNGSYGFKISGSSTNNNTVTGNNILSNSGCGLSLYGSSDNTISGNNISSNDKDGIYMWSSSNNIIAGNDFISNNWSGVSFEESSDNTVGHNNITSHNDCGIYLWHSSNNTITENNIANNTQGIFIYALSNSTNVRNNTLSNSDNGIYLITASHCTITGNNFTNNLDGLDLELYSINNSITGNNISSNDDCGIELDSTSNNNTISGNNITDNKQGIYFSGSYNNTITGNDISFNSDCGISLNPASNSIITGNNISNNLEGVYSSGSYNNTIAYNNISWNIDCGIFLNTASNNNTISGNDISNNLEGIYLTELFNNTITFNNISWNSDCGIFIYAASNDNNISGNNITSNDLNGIYFDGASYNNTIAFNNISSNIVNGIYLSQSSNNTVTCNNISNNDDGIELDSASNNRVTGNNIYMNNDCSIYLGSASKNTITGNYILNNTHGIFLDALSKNNTIAGNIVLNNDNGITIWQSSNNSIFHNSIVNNTNQAFDDTISGNQWDNGYPSGGNYWSDYAGADIFSGPEQDIPGSDWIGDSNYTIDADSIDRYPLMLPIFLIPPIISNVAADPDFQETGQWVNITCDVFDNIGVYNIWVNITVPGGGYINDSMAQGLGDQWFYNSTHSLLGLYSYTIWASDINNNWNSSSGYSFAIQDTTLPVISNVYDDPDIQETGDWVNITCDVIDNVGVCDVWVNITLPSGGYINVSMTKGSGNQWYFNDTHTLLGLYPYTIWANDTSNNWISSSGYSFIIQDTTLPVISNELAFPGTQEIGGWINITCNVTDNVGVFEVWVNITVPGGGYINDSMTQGSGDQWFYNNTYTTLGLYQYTIWTNDTSNNLNSSSGHTFTIYYPDLPMISNVFAFPGTQETGGWVNITCDVTDNIGVYEVRVNITLPGGGYTNASLIKGSGDQWFYNNTHITLGLYAYTVWAIDISDNWNSSLGYIFTIRDSHPPEITNPTVTPGIQESGGRVNITVDVTDNLGLGNVWVNITLPDGSFANITMTKGSGDEWYLDAPYLKVGAYPYTVWANDTSDNWNSSSGNTFTVIDTVAPEIADIRATPDIQSAGSSVNITCNTTGVYGVWVNITLPDGSTINVSMTKGPGDLWYYDTVYIDLGVYDYVIWSNDSFGNWNSSQGHIFTIEPGPAFNIILISGDGQSGTVGTRLTGPLVIEVQDGFGNVVSNAMVRFNVTLGGGSLDITSPVFTNPEGRAQTNLTLGTTSGQNEVSAEIHGGGITQVIFIAIGEPGAPYNLVIVSGNNAQTGAIGNRLDHAFVVQVFDKFGNIVPNANVWFNVTAGFGSLDTTNPVPADGNGRAQTNLTLGTAAGTNTVSAEIGGGGTTQVIFTATGLSTEPVINTKIPNIELPEDGPPYLLDLSTNAIDDVDASQDLMWFITNSDNSLYTVSGQGTDTLIITTKPNEFGNDLVTLWVMDSGGLQDSQPLWINITPVNDKPFFFPKPPDLTITGDVPYTFDYEPYIHDFDNDISDLTISSSDPDHISVAGHKVTYTYPSSLIGKQVFVILILGDGLDDASEVIQVNITDDKVPTVIKELPDVAMYEGDTRLNVFDLDDYFDDPDGDSIYFSYGYTHLNIIINENHSVDFLAESNWFGEETVTFRARDPNFAIAEDTIKVRVHPRNDPPSISGVPDLVVRYNATYRFDLAPYISDIDNSIAELSLSFLEFSGNAWVGSEHIHVSSSNNLKMAINYSEVHLGTVFRVMVEVSDGLASSWDEINITVSEDWPPELEEEMPDLLIFEDEHISNYFNVRDYFTDPDNDTLFYTYGQIHVGIIIHENGSVDFYAEPNWYGTENITIRATDLYGALSEDIITVTVLPVNDFPTLSQIPDQEGMNGETWILDLGPYISDVDNNINELEIICDSAYIIVAGTVLIFQYPVDITEEAVQIIVRDPGNASATAVFNTTLTKAEIVGSGGVEFVQYILTIILTIAILATVLLLYALHKGKYEVEEMFLVYAKSGTLIAHNYQGEKEFLDRDIMAGMFTAVQDFISDAFDPEDHSKVPLKVMEIGDRKVMIERGEYTYLAAVFRGGIWRLASRIKKTVVNIETQYRDLLLDWDGDMDEFKGIHKLLDCLMESD